jgi:hypothetical protein
VARRGSNVTDTTQLRLAAIATRLALAARLCWSRSPGRLGDSDQGKRAARVSETFSLEVTAMKDAVLPAMASDERRRWLALYILCVGMLMIVLDATIVNVALATIQEDLGFSQNDLAWVVNGYLIAFGGLLLLSGCRDSFPPVFPRDADSSCDAALRPFRGGLENRCGPQGPPRVRIPPPSA